MPLRVAMTETEQSPHLISTSSRSSVAMGIPTDPLLLPRLGSATPPSFLTTPEILMRSISPASHIAEPSGLVDGRIPCTIAHVWTDSAHCPCAAARRRQTHPTNSFNLVSTAYCRPKLGWGPSSQKKVFHGPNHGLLLPTLPTQNIISTSSQRSSSATCVNMYQVCRATPPPPPPPPLGHPFPGPANLLPTPKPVRAAPLISQPCTPR